MNNKQSSIEWFADEIFKIINKYEPFAFDYYLEKAFERAKEMHKQEIIDAVDGFPLENRNMLGEEYYENTFKE